MHPKNLSPVMKADRVNPLRPHGNNSDIKPQIKMSEDNNMEDIQLRQEQISDGSRGAPKRPSDNYVNPRRVSAGMRTLDSAKKAQAIVDEENDAEEE